MKFDCACGATIFDGTDGLRHKAHAIADTDWNGFWDALDAALDHPGRAGATSMALRGRARARPVYECAACGRLWVGDGDGGLLGYSPDNGRQNRVFSA